MAHTAFVGERLGPAPEIARGAVDAMSSTGEPASGSRKGLNAQGRQAEATDEPRKSTDVTEPRVTARAGCLGR